MDEFTWMWMFQNWLQDQKDMHKTYKDYALLMGWFYNPEAASRMAKQDNPDYETSDEEFEKSYEVVSKHNEVSELGKHRRLRKVVE